jgi:hypothetical protein
LLAALEAVCNLPADDAGNRTIPAGFLDQARAAIAKAEAAAPMMKLVIEHQTDDCVRLSVNYAGKRWTIDVSADFEEDGGIGAYIGRDEVLCTSAEFGWDEKHVNEPQD